MFATLHVPQSDPPINNRCKGLAIGTEGDEVGPIHGSVAEPPRFLKKSPFSTRPVPQPQRIAFAPTPRSQGLAIRAECHAHNYRVLPHQATPLLACGYVPQADTIAAARN